MTRGARIIDAPADLPVGAWVYNTDNMQTALAAGAFLTDSSTVWRTAFGGDFGAEVADNSESYLLVGNIPPIAFGADQADHYVQTGLSVDKDTWIYTPTQFVTTYIPIAVWSGGANPTVTILDSDGSRVLWSGDITTLYGNDYTWLALQRPNGTSDLLVYVYSNANGAVTLYDSTTDGALGRDVYFLDGDGGSGTATGTAAGTATGTDTGTDTGTATGTDTGTATGTDTGTAKACDSLCTPLNEGIALSVLLLIIIAVMVKKNAATKRASS